MYADRIDLLKKIEADRGSKVILFVTGDRPGWETQIASDSKDLFVDHLDGFGKADKISLVLYTRGGDTLSAWSIINLIRQFCNEWEVIVPHKALSAGTLMCLGSDRIIMTKQATLGPIDPSVNNPLNPEIPGSTTNARMPVSVEEVKGFIDMAKEELATSSSDALAPIFLKLTEHVHPLVLGQIYRTRSQIQFLARKLLQNHMDDILTKSKM